MIQEKNKRWIMAIALVSMFALAMFFVFLGIKSSNVFINEGDQGLIVLSDVSLIQDRNRFYLDAMVDIQLPITIQAGLDSGVPLIFVLTLQFLEPRKYWLDKQLETIEYRFSLSIHGG